MTSHTQDVIINLGQLHATIREAETNQRGYLLTDNTFFLENYHQAREQVVELQQELALLIKDNPGQMENLQLLDQLIKRRFQKLDEIIRNYSQNQPFDLDASNQTMQEVKATILTMQREEDRLLDLRSDRENYYASRALWLIALFVSSILVLMVIAFYRIRRDVHKRLEAEHILEENNQQLEHKVEERTREISKNEERYRFMADSIPHIVWTAEPNGEFDFYSRQWADYSGASLEESLGWAWANFIHPDDLEPTLEIWKEGLEKAQESKVEHRVRGKDGVYRWMQSRAVPYKNEEGQVMKWFGTTTLIDDEVKAKEAARQQGELLQNITDSVPVLISYMDSDFRYQFVNATYEKWFKVPREEIVNQFAWEVIGKEGFERIKGFAEEALKGNVVNAETETYYPQLGNRHIRFNLIPRFEGNRIIGLYILVDDITDTKRIENELRAVLLETEAKNLELKRINQILDDFVSLAAHDLKSPVSNLKLSVLLINKLNKPEEKLRVIGQLDQSIRRLDKTLSGLLEIVEVQHVKDAKVSCCQFREVVEEVMVHLKAPLLESGGELQVHFDEAPGILYIRAYLNSIVHNLLSNAIKYRSPKRPPKIEIFSEPKGDGVLLICRDNGIGMDLEKVGSKLFKPFKRFTSEVEGTGVGLHLVKSIIERNGGSIVVESLPDRGTTFKCFLKNMQINESLL